MDKHQKNERKKIDYSFIVLIIILIICVFFVLQVTVFGQGYVNVFGYTIFHVVTGSMEETIMIDDLVLVKLGNNDYQVGDIITYQFQGNYITHRIIDIDNENNEITTKGDANNKLDDPISKNDVVGKVVHIFPNVGIWIKVFKEPIVIVAIVVAIIIIKLLFFR